MTHASRLCGVGEILHAAVVDELAAVRTRPIRGADGAEYVAHILHGRCEGLGSRDVAHHPGDVAGDLGTGLARVARQRAHDVALVGDELREDFAPRASGGTGDEHEGLRLDPAGWLLEFAGERVLRGRRQRKQATHDDNACSHTTVLLVALKVTQVP